MKAVVFLDLDDSIFQTLSKCRDSTSSLMPAAIGTNNLPRSFSTPPQSYLLNHILANALIIPTTSRNVASFNRVLIHFKNEAILNYGGLILSSDRKICESYLDIISPLAREATSTLQETFAFLETLICKDNLNLRVRIINDGGLDFYIVIKSPVGDLEALKLLKTNYELSIDKIPEIFPDEPVLQVYLNGNNLSFVPSYLNKARAVDYYLNNILTYPREDIMVLGLGDSFSDREFLKLCDFYIIPKFSQLWGSL
jgi:hydroxymethylpyrimidine pyrophosphatase-like HAD family hydrolase